MGEALAVKKQGITVESFNAVVQSLVPQSTAATLILGGGDPTATVKGTMELPEKILTDAGEYTKSKEAECAANGKIFTNSTIAVVEWAGQKPSEPAQLEITTASFWTWFYCNNVLKGETEFDALSVGAVVLTADSKILIQERSGKVTLGEGKLSIPASFVTKKPAGEEFNLSALLPETMGKNIGVRKLKKLAFIGLFKDNSVSKNNIQALFATKVELTSEELRANFPNATCQEKTARYEFVGNDETSLGLYIVENLERMLPHTQIGLLAYGCARYGKEWVERISTELSREKFSAMFAGT